MDNSLCNLLPKIELHAHLNGSISVETLKELREYRQKEEHKIIEDYLQKWEKTFQQLEISTLSECFDIFKIAHSFTKNPKAVQIATERVIEDFAKDNVIYLELRSTLRKEADMTKDEYLESMIKGVKNCKSLIPNIIVKLIVSINRKDTLEEAEENVDLAIKYSKFEPDIVVGIDLSGDPNKKSFTDYIEILNKARNEGLKLTIHFAEIPNCGEVYEVLKYKPDRLGHGTCVHENCAGDVENWTSLLKSEIPVEVCITSNIKCRTVVSADKHHFSYLYNAKHPVVVCTDDKSVFQTDLSNEFKIIQSTFKLSMEEVWALSYSAVSYIFADDTVKSTLIDILTSWKKEFL